MVHLKNWKGIWLFTISNHCGIYTMGAFRNFGNDVPAFLLGKEKRLQCRYNWPSWTNPWSLWRAWKLPIEAWKLPTNDIPWHPDCSIGILTSWLIILHQQPSNPGFLFFTAQASIHLDLTVTVSSSILPFTPSTCSKSAMTTTCGSKCNLRKYKVGSSQL